MLEINKIYNQDCISGMKLIEDNSIDFIISDLPYGVTYCKWDKKINLLELWEQFDRILKVNGAVVLTSTQPFTTELINSNIKNFRYEWIWKKNNCTGFVSCKIRPLRNHESICVFYRKLPVFNHQGLVKISKVIKAKKSKGGRMLLGDNYERSTRLGKEYIQEYTNYPKSVLEINRNKENLHPTQKPVELFEYLIKTYTNENEVVLDCCMGSGTTAIACINSSRNYIGFELNKEFYNIAEKRIREYKDSVL